MSKRTSLTARSRSVAAAMTAAAGKGDSRPVVGLTIRLSADKHDKLRRLAFDRRVSIHSLLLSGVDMVLAGEQ